MRTEHTLDKIRRFAQKNMVLMAFLMAGAVFLINIVLNPASLNRNAIGSILALTSLLAIAGAGETLVVVTGSGIDLSAGPIMSLAGILAVHFMDGKDQNIALVFFLGILLGGFFGLLNGLGVTWIKLPSMIITYAMSNVITRLQFIVTKGKPTGSAAPTLTAVLSYRVFDVIPAIFLFCIALSVLFLLLLRHTKFGHRLYLVGDSATVATYTGISQGKIVVLTYVLAGVLYGLAGTISAGYLTYVQCSMLDVYTMKCIVAVVIGGASLYGGKGSYYGTIAGASFIVVLSNCLAVLRVQEAVQNVIMGLVIIAVLTLYNREKGTRT